MNEILRWEAQTRKEVTGCVVWIAETKAHYPSFQAYGQPTLVHRWAYETFVGPVPDGYEADHLCDNKRCSNPKHLAAVTHAQNRARTNAPDAVNARKTECKRGHPFEKANTGSTNGGRYCRKCKAMHCKLYRERKKAAA